MARNNTRQRYERDFPIKVDVERSPTGIGERLDMMMAWSTQRMGKGEWACMGARFYFKTWPDAARFSMRWLEDEPASIRDRTPIGHTHDWPGMMTKESPVLRKRPGS